MKQAVSLTIFSLIVWNSLGRLILPFTSLYLHKCLFVNSWGKVWKATSQTSHGACLEEGTEKGELGGAHRQQSWFLDVALLCGWPLHPALTSLMQQASGMAVHRYNNNYSFLTAIQRGSVTSPGSHSWLRADPGLTAHAADRQTSHQDETLVLY